MINERNNGIYFSLQYHGGTELDKNVLSWMFFNNFQNAAYLVWKLKKLQIESFDRPIEG